MVIIVLCKMKTAALCKTVAMQHLSFPSMTDDPEHPFRSHIPRTLLKKNEICSYGSSYHAFSFIDCFIILCISYRFSCLNGTQCCYPNQYDDNLKIQRLLLQQSTDQSDHTMMDPYHWFTNIKRQL